VAKTIRYAVAGLGWISQVAVLPAFRNARNAELAALVSGNAAKREQLAGQYGISHAYDYRQFDALMKSGAVDAVYIALPNDMHREYAVKAARAGVHVLCEKPMAVTEQACEDMIRAARENGVKLMIAYRLHFEPANLEAIQVLQSGRIGEPRYFSSVFSQQVPEGNIRLANTTKGGGTLYDIGIYCINAARYLFRAEPEEVLATTVNNGEPRFREVETTASAVLRFPGSRVAAFTCSFGAANADAYRVVGTKGDIRLEPGYSFTDALKVFVTVDGKTEEQAFPKSDQFGPQLDYFADCIRENRDPEPGGYEGLADVRIIRALYRSAAKGGRPVTLEPYQVPSRPSPAREIDRPAVEHPPVVNAEDPGKAA
jgi:glucose-fructose oxidoreductase